MCNAPEWLPPIKPLKGDWGQDVNELYEIFLSSFIEDNCYFHGKLIWPNKNKIDGEREEGFWHLITREDYNRRERYPDYRRAERLGWVRPLIENSEDQRVKTFDWLHNGKTRRTHIWLEECDFIIILEEFRKGGAMHLITAYHLDDDYQRNKFLKRYEERIQ